MYTHTATYHDMLEYIKFKGQKRDDRTGTGTIGVFGYQNYYSLEEGFPILTTKRVNFKAVLLELLWFLSGSENVRWLQSRDVHIWDEWADENGDLGPVYGSQWRSWPNYKDIVNPIDQIKGVINDIKRNPSSRRHIVSAWNPVDVPDMALPPCHCLFQFYVQGNKLSCQLYQRSADVFLGVPFNIASYALLTHMIAHVCHLEVGSFIHTFGDLHIYLNHLDQVKEQLSRDPFMYAPPRLLLDSDVRDIDSFTEDSIKLQDYLSYTSIKAPISV